MNCHRTEIMRRGLKKRLERKERNSLQNFECHAEEMGMILTGFTSREVIGVRSLKTQERKMRDISGEKIED